MKYTGWLPFDPLCAILVALNIIYTGLRLMRSSVAGLMDEADPDFDRAARAALDRETAARGVEYRELRHRRAGPVTWMEVHLLFPDETPLQEAHRVATAIEEAVGAQLGPDVRVTPTWNRARISARVHEGDQGSAFRVQ